MITRTHLIEYVRNDNIKEIIEDRIAKDLNANLNDMDVSEVTDMSELFKDSSFNGDISKWNVSKVTNMKRMFENSDFNRDISNWNVSSVTNMECMFVNSKFDGDISNWDVKNVIKHDMCIMCSILEKKTYQQPKFSCVMNNKEVVKKSKQMIASKQRKIYDNKNDINNIDFLIETAINEESINKLNAKKNKLLKENELLKIQIMGLKQIASYENND